MAKIKLSHQKEANGGGLSREDRKNEQICRMIERAEKQRLKREEKKKLAVLNKTAAKVGPRKKKVGLLSTKRTQVAIRILFSENVKAQNASNRYFFERKQTIEEKQRMEQEEMWARYALRVQQHQAALAATSLTLPPLPALHDNLSSSAAVPQIYNPAFAGVFQQQTDPIGAGLQVPQQLAYVAPAVGNTTHQQFYLNAGETGGNYEVAGGAEDHSGSSCFSSTSKKQQEQNQPTQMQQLNFGVRGFQVPTPAPVEETKEAAPTDKTPVVINVKVNKAVADATITAAAATEAEPQTEEQKILELTRQKMSRSKQ